MNNTYKALLIIFFINMLVINIMGMTVNNNTTIQDSLEDMDQDINNDNLFEIDTDLTKEYTDNSNLPMSRWKAIQQLFTSRITVKTTGYNGLELEVMQYVQIFMWLINIMGVILIYRLFRGSQ